MGALDGIRVIDAGMIVQGPQAGQTMADMGADVIKVELPGLGDQSRAIPLSADDPRAPYFIANNRGKRSMTLDLRTPGGTEAFLKLIETADVVISNFKAGTLDEWGVGYEHAAARNPGIIYGMGTTFGPAGPASTREGADLAGQAAGGLISTTGQGGGPPTPVGAVVADHAGAQNLTIGVLAALVSRGQTGQGQRIDVSLFGSQLYAQASEYTAFFLNGKVPGRSNFGHPLLPAVYGIVQTADGWIALVGVPPQQRVGFYTAIERLDLLEDPRFERLILDPQDRIELFKILTPTFKRRTSAEWGERLTEAGCRWAPVNDYAAAAEDPHGWINGYFHEVDHPEYGKTGMIGTPIQMSGTPLQPGKLAPELGADTELMLVELGYSWDEITELRNAGAI